LKRWLPRARDCSAAGPYVLWRLNQKNAAASVSEAVRKHAGENWENLENIFQDRVGKALEKLGAPGESRLAEMERTIDDLRARISKLEAEAKPKATAKPAAKRKTRPREADKSTAEA
jgi:BMFP domain-containing protein YqiC